MQLEMNVLQLHEVYQLVMSDVEIQVYNIVGMEKITDLQQIMAYIDDLQIHDQ
jgi:hypothetical protein